MSASKGDGIMPRRTMKAVFGFVCCYAFGGVWPGLDSTHAQYAVERPQTSSEASAAQQAQRRALQQRIQRARAMLHDLGLTDDPPPIEPATLADVLEERKTTIERRSSQRATDRPASPRISESETASNGQASMRVSPNLLSPKRDPFATTALMYEQAKRVGTGPVFVAASGNARIPRLTLRGYVEGDGQEPVALLQVGNAEVYVVRKGDTISLHEGGGLNTVLKVKEISKLSALVEIGTLGQVIVVR
ncbi:MAG: hypothetical protein D6690_02500 [Nitrospirae bacterium]|nr:MAG: hypothetical protein D6690_02500 [Nitrospirota bacterium]